MNETTVGRVASKLNLSKTTVSKAVRHCSGVDSETRQTVLDEFRFVTLHPQSNCAIYAIIPDVPHYFWEKLRLALREGEQKNIAPIKYNIYTNPRDEATVLTYLDEAEQLNAQVIIISAYITPTIQSRLENLSDGRLILFLCEYHELINSFFVGGDPYADGYLMGKYYMSKYFEKNLVILSIPNSYNIEQRLSGFVNAINEENATLIEKATFINLERSALKDSKLLPSKLAPCLKNAASSEDSLCIYVPFGLQSLPLAITKANLTGKVICMCHDYFPKKAEDYISITCNQNLQEQGLLAAKLATDYIKEHYYPENKKTIIPSVIKHF